MIPRHPTKSMRSFSALSVCLIAGAASLLASPDAMAQTVLRVDDDALPGGDGSSWAAAFNDLQLALDVATASPAETFEIRVAGGVYVPSKRTDAGDPRSATFAMQSGVEWLGGYAGIGESKNDIRDPEVFQTILTGDLSSDDGPDFTNYEENAYHVVTGSGTDATAILDGLVVSRGNADVNAGTDAGTHLGGGVFVVTGNPVVRGCTFTQNAALTGAGVFGRLNSSLTLEDCVFEGNRSAQAGAAARQSGPGVFTMTRCRVIGNESGEVTPAVALQGNDIAVLQLCEFIENSGSGVHISDGEFLVDRCAFERNTGAVGGGLSIGDLTLGVISSCSFRSNQVSTAGGGAVIPSTVDVINCEFIENSSAWFGGGAFAGEGARFINCAFARNTGDIGGGLYNSGPLTLINCSFGANSGGAVTSIIATTATGELTSYNCVFWGNTPGELINDTEFAVPAGALPPPPVLTYCDIQGGWTGPGFANLNVDPLFVQPGCGNLRLAHGSLCIDAGDNSAVPPGTDTDLDSQPRILNSIVDMGPYEGGHDMLPLTACESSLDAGEFVRLIPAGGPYNPITNPVVSIFNNTEVNGAWAAVTQIDQDTHLGASGYRELASILDLETSLVDGEHFSRVMVSFTLASLGGIDPLTVDAVYFDAAANTWRLAALTNTMNSPGHDSTLGDRTATVGGGSAFGLSGDLGDYGVFWNPIQQRGFAWANVDHATEFAVGILLPACPADCASPADETVDISDLLAVVNAWGVVVPGTPADVNADNLVNIDDLLEIVHHWGPCP